MSLIKWNGNDLFPKLDSIWDDFLNRDIFKRGMDLGTTMPAVNTRETENAYSLEVAIPGLKREDLKIDLDKDTLTISSERKDEKEEKDGERITRREFSYSSFQRSFQLPENVRKEDISAEYSDGILRLTLPKTENTPATEKKQIEIR